MNITTRLIPLAAVCMICALTYTPRAEAASVVAVTNCNDSGPGSLRGAILAAPDGATIDLRSLGCNRISLTSGAIAIAQADLQLLGRNRTALTVDGNGADRVLRHTGSGTLRITRLTLADGSNAEQFASGGCVYSQARVVLESSSLHDCHAVAVKNPDEQCELGCSTGASGGALAAHEVVLADSLVYASSASDFTSQGGAVFALDRLTMFNSRLSGNDAMYGTAAYTGEFIAHDSLIDHNGFEPGDTQSYSETGAVHVYEKQGGQAQAVLVRSAVTDNGAYGCAAVCVEGRGAIVDSTVARNQGKQVLAFRDEGLVANSTVAMNRASTAIVTRPVLCQGAIATPMLMLDSSIVALNRCGSNYALDIGGGTVAGTHNLVQYSRAPLPADTLRVNPKLQTLRNNGGPTPTMALIDGSPAIDHGANTLGLSWDQRGGGFGRVTGVSADIGAFERPEP